MPSEVGMKIVSGFNKKKPTLKKLPFTPLSWTLNYTFIIWK